MEMLAGLIDVELPVEEKPKKDSGAVPKVVEDYTAKFRRSIMDQLKDYPLPVPVISLNQNGNTIPFMTKKSFSLWQGKQKSKKTTALALAVAAFIMGENAPADSLFQGSVNGSVLFFDNEQGESYAARTMNLILKLANVRSSTRLIYCDLREFSPPERMKIIQAGIEATENVCLVIIDGLVDLLTDFMDASEGHFTTTEILKLCSAYDIHVAGVLHQNKGDKNARAHIGSISSQKCEVEIATEVDGEDRSQSIVECVNSRGLPFEKFAIRWDKGSLPRVNAQWSMVLGPQAKAIKQNDIQKTIAWAIFTPLASLSHKDAIEKIASETKKCESTAKNYLTNYLNWGFVTKGEDGFYRRKDPEGSRVNEGQNGVN